MTKKNERFKIINIYVLPCLHKPGFKSQSLLSEATRKNQIKI
jgi:hypothetical protein